jgi:uncharacterized protein YndB with AHSA1/START domain
MVKIESQVTIARPPEEVFGYFLALDENVPKTNPDVEWVVKTPDGPTRVGTTLRSRGRSLGKVRETTMRFTEIVPNERIRFEAVVGPMRPNCTFTFDQTDGGTTVTFRGDPNPVGVFKMLSPVFKRIGQKVWSERLARAKAALEDSLAAST